MRKTFLTALVLFVLGVFLQAQDLKIHHINVGQGDCTLIVSPTGKTMLIDAGNNGKGTSAVLPYLQGLGVTTLDYVVATHYHADHIGGSDEVINALAGTQIGTVFDRGTANPVPTTATYTSYVPAATSAVGGRQTLALGQVIDLGGGVTMTCLATDGAVLGSGPVPSATSSENDLSNAWLLRYNEFRYFTGGDCGGETTYYADLETPLAQVVGPVDSFKVNHHGSRYSTNQTFLSALNPTSAVIMVGNGNTYGHPVQTVLDRLATANCFTYLTEAGAGGTVAAGQGVVANGSVVIATTGHTTYTVSYGGQTQAYPLHASAPVGVTVSLSPATVSLAAGSTQAFTATVANAADSSVTWSCSAGSITAAGLFTAPAAATSCTVTATSVADPTQSASATVTVTAAASTTFSEAEANNTLATANVVGDSVTRIVGYFPSSSDSQDWFAVTLLAGHTLAVDMTGPTASNQNYDLYLYSSGGTKLATSAKSGTTERVTYKNTNVAAAKTLLIKVLRKASYSYVTPYTLTLSR